jgi:transposase
MVVEQGRYVGIDLGKRSWEMAVITRSGKCRRNEQGDLEPEERTAFYRGTMTAEGRLKLYKLLKAGDKVVVETGNLAFLMAKELERAAGCRVRVLSSHHLPIIYATDKKTDKEDSLKLAHLTADRPDSRLPIVPVPSDKEMEKRKVLSSYRRAQENRTRAINQIHGLFVLAGITAVGKKDLADAERRGEMIRHLSGFEREEAEYLAEILVIYERRIGELMYTILKKKTDYEVRHLRVGRLSAGTLAREALSA